MKKFSLLLLAALAQMADAQQLSNTSFDSEWVNCYPWEAGSFASTARGTQPEGWCVSNVSQSQLPIVGEEVSPGANGTGKAVKLNNVQASIGDNTAPGYITLGTAFATAETKMTSVRNADGGVFGGIAFTYHPDAIRLTYKSNRSAGEENMSVIVYLWKGTWAQADVPSNTAVGIFSWGSATKVTMTDRIQNILGKECLTGGEITKTDDAALIASVEYYSNVAQDEWVTKEIPLNYGEYAGRPVDVEKLNIVIASNGLFDDRGLIRNGNSVTVDDVELVYWHGLSSLSFEDAALDFSEETTCYDLSSVIYDEAKLAYTVKGQAASVTKSYNEETAVLTIRVEGEDFAINPDSFTEYTVQFKVAEVVEPVVNNTYQLPNTTFDSDWVNCYPWESGVFVNAARGTQPEGWRISNVANSAIPIVASEEVGADGTGKSVKLSNVTALVGGQNAPGYITLGTAWATAETKMITVRNADGGVFGGIAFEYHPDAVRFTYKSDRSAGEENMSVIAYLWKGTWTQAEVPSNTAIGISDWGNAVKVTMTDRIQNIFGKECLTGGEITKTDDAALIASAEYYSNEAQDEWTTKEIPLNYGEYAGQPVDVEKLNIVIASNGFFEDRGAIISGNSVTIDDVELVYYHALSSLSYEGASLLFSEGVTSYNLSDLFYDETKLAYTVKGQAATAATLYNGETGLLTIRVEGEDFACDPNAFTEYKILFRPDNEKFVPKVKAEKTELIVDEQTTLTLENCDGLVAEYSAPNIISYENGVVTALGGGTVTLILTQPETETIEARVFEIEFTVSKLDAVWAWNVEDRYYYPNTVVENAFQLSVGDASLLSLASSSSKIAKLDKDGSLTIGNTTGVATITIRHRGSSRWNASKQQYVVKVAEPGHVPFELTKDLYELIKDNISGGQGWDSNGGIRLGNNSEIFSWSNKDFVMAISGIPDKLSFTYQSSSGASSRDYRIFESADGENFTEIWRDNRGSGVDGNSYQSGDIQLNRDTRYIKFHYYGNCAAYYRNIKVTELHKFECDTQEMHLNETVSTGSFTFTHANADKITITVPQAITLSPARITGGMDIYGEQVVKVNYNVDKCDVDDDIVITDGTNTVKIHVVARLEDPDAIVTPFKEEEEKTDIFNLSGQRIQKMQKGINIVNGKKILK